MSQPITHFCITADRESAMALLDGVTGRVNGNVRLLVFEDADGPAFDPTFVDADVPITRATGNMIDGVPERVRKDGFFFNVVLDDLDASLPGLVGAGYGPPDDFTLVYGIHPETPQRVFAQTSP